MERKNAFPPQSDQAFESSLHPRYRWLDLLRGVYLLFFFIASLTWMFSADIRALEYPIGPTWLNFGYKYVDFYPRMITLIDLGSQIFMFILGLSLSISFHSKLEKKGVIFAWISVINRVCVFFLIAQVIFSDLLTYNVNDIVVLSIWTLGTIISVIFRNTKFKKRDFRFIIGLIWSLSSVILWFFKMDADIWTIFFGNDLAYLAWGTLFGALGIFLIRNPDYRIIIPICLMGIHFFLWEVYSEWNIILLSGTSFEFSFMVPFKLMGLSAVALTSTCVWDWMHKDPNDIKLGIKSRVIPLMSITFIGQFVIDFFQTADSDSLNASIVFLGIALSCAFAMLAKAIDSFYKFNIPILTNLGKNALFLFIFQSLLMIPYRLIWPGGGQYFRTMVSQWFGVTTTHALVNFMGILAFIIPITILILFAWILNRLKIHIRI
ncbi:MAG: hypothetical protein ACTSRE_12630 [Promethearchaeota archaeon]